MKEIEYRAKVLNTKKWIYRQPFHIRGTWYMYNSLWDMVPIDHKTIGQYTGSRDMIGSKIYEYDVLNIKGSKRRYVVQWNDEESAFTVAYKYANNEPGEMVISDFRALFKVYEIIGNKFDNPELLEGAK